MVELFAGPSAPRMISLRGQQQNLWRNRADESLPAFVELGGARLPLTWHLAPHSARVDSKQVIFVYESKQPHLRLAWQWTARAGSGEPERS
jgi:hypothetical protein